MLRLRPRSHDGDGRKRLGVAVIRDFESFFSLLRMKEKERSRFRFQWEIRAGQRMIYREAQPLLKG